jgi:hypothetical protein
MKSLLRQKNLIMDLNIIYNELYANVSKEIVEHEVKNLLKWFLKWAPIKKRDENKIGLKLGVFHV